MRSTDTGQIVHPLAVAGCLVFIRECIKDLRKLFAPHLQVEEFVDYCAIGVLVDHIALLALLARVQVSGLYQLLIGFLLYDPADDLIIQNHDLPKGPSVLLWNPHKGKLLGFDWVVVVVCEHAEII